MSTIRSFIEMPRDTSISIRDAGQRPNELNCGGDVGLPRLAVLITVHRDAIDCTRAIVWAVACIRRVYRLALGLGWERRGLPRAGRGFGVMAPPHQTPHVCGPVHNLSHAFGSIACCLHAGRAQQQK